MPVVFPGIAQSALIVGRPPPVRGRRPRRPARALHDADPIVPAAGRGRPARTRGSAPQFVQDSQFWEKRVALGCQPAPQGGTFRHWIIRASVSALLLLAAAALTAQTNHMQSKLII